MDKRLKSPYRNKIDDYYIENRKNIIRWRKTIEFIDVKGEYKKGLDLGDRTPLTNELEKIFNCPFENTTIDLDTEELKGNFDVITAFEVIEHLFNPLHCLLQVHKVLKPYGVFYLSTPKQKPHFLWSKDHFHEMHYDSIKALLLRSGFKIIRKRTFRNRPFYFYFTGIRPFLRGIWEKYLIFELVKQ